MCSCSIKSVLPTVAPELDDADLCEVSDCGQARITYIELLAPESPLALPAHLIEVLRIYRQRDSLAMVRLAQFFADGLGGGRTSVANNQAIPSSVPEACMSGIDLLLRLAIDYERTHKGEPRC